MTAPFIEIFQYDLPLVRPLRLKGIPITRRQGLILKAGRGDQRVGYGEIAPLPGFSIETLEQAKEAAIKWVDLFRRMTREENIAGSDGEPALGFLLNTPSVFFGTECATLGLARSSGATEGGSGVAGARRIPVSALIIGDFEGSIERASKLWQEGYRALKLKVGAQSVARDIEMVKQVCAAAGGIDIRLDANAAWDFDTAVAFARGIAALDIEYIEEPLADPDRLGELVNLTGLQVALDETVVHGVFDDQFFADRDWAAAVVLKPTVLGGITTCRDLAAEAMEQGIQPVVSSCFESGLGLVALAHLAESLTGEAVPAGLDTYSWLAEDTLARRFTIHDGDLDLDEMEACAATVNTDAMEKIYSG
jgi:O-succinylbenzoate synthase